MIMIAVIQSNQRNASNLLRGFVCAYIVHFTVVCGMNAYYHASNVVHDKAECLLCNELCSRSNDVETSLQLPQLNRMPELSLFSIFLILYLSHFFSHSYLTVALSWR